MSKLWGIDLDAPIIPGQSAAGISIDTSINNLLRHNQPIAIRQLSGLVLYDFGPVRIWCKGDIISQVGVGRGYRGSLLNEVRVGSTINDIDFAFHCTLEEDEEDNLVIPGLPGLSFESEEWQGNRTIDDNRQARVTEMFVFRERPGALDKNAGVVKA